MKIWPTLSALDQRTTPSDGSGTTLTPATDELVGAKRRYATLRSWLQGWKEGNPSQNPLVIVGDVGCGKSTVATAHAASFGFDLITSDGGEERHTDHFKRLNSDGRMPTFFGERRLVLIDDAHLINSRCWDIVRSYGTAFPCIITCTDANDVPYAVRKSGVTWTLENPTKADLVEYGERLVERLGLAHQYADIANAAETIQSWRGMKHALLTTPPGFDFHASVFTPIRVGHQQVASILAGQYQHPISVHPMALLAAAEYNHADPDDLKVANWLYSQSWAVEGLSQVASSYLGTLRAKTQDKPPFRKRSIRGATRRT